MKTRLRFVKTPIYLLTGAAVMLAQEPPVPPAPPAAPAPMAVPAAPAPLMMAFQEDAGRAPRPPRPPRPPRMSESSSDHEYRSGQSALNDRNYDRAIDYFSRVIEEKNPRADGALYWKAYAENKAGKRSDALASIAALRKDYPRSRWIEDAKALEVEVRQNSGSAPSPEATNDEEMKLLVLNSMINTDPDRTVPILEKLLKGTNSPKVKERALFVLAQSQSAKARETLAQVAKGNYNPDLQAKAVEYLGVFGGRQNGQLLSDVYKSNGDLQVKRSILRSFMISGNREALLAAAKGEQNTELRTEAIRLLGQMGSSSDLMQLYTPDAPPEVKRAILQGLFISGNSDRILEIARNDKDPAMRREAVRQLGPMGRNKASDGLAGLYTKETDPSIKREIMNALFIQGNAQPLIEIARKESDPGLKREAVKKLSIMHSKEATDFLLELLNK